ncbi:MAG TPA: DUF4097 family beta strand repeat-containing protein [Gemmatimonadaceae bacterium]|nr:DUF4097 family beta strand repeat-containing protein [Gemmatimonadaceae bacterium]
MARVLLSAVLTVAGSATAGAQSRYYGESLDTVVTLDRQATVDLSLFSGRVTVTGGTGNQARIHAFTDRGDLQFDAEPGRIRLQIDPSRGGRGDGTFELTVPAGTRVIVNSISAPISVRGAKGEVDINSVSGGVIVQDAARKVKASSVSGNVDVSQVAGDVRASSVSGHVDANDISGDLETETVSGRIMMMSAKSRFVRAGSVSGRISYSGTFAPDGTYEFKSHSGGVRLVLPADVGAQLRIETFSGSVDSDFPVTLQPSDDGRGAGRKMEFKIGNGRSRIVAESFSGSIKLERADGRDLRD